MIHRDITVSGTETHTHSGGIGAIHSSSWVAWGCYLTGFALTLTLSPRAAEDLSNIGAGALILALGVAAFFAAVIYLQRQMRLQLEAAHYGEPLRLVQEGPFAISRNPIYLSFLVPLATFAWYSPIAAALAVVTYLLVMTVFVIRGEEQDLEAKFGDLYRRYKQRTPRWLFF
jgi:protein-S-isoprenylcysteine O-methyltransferase Ste14